MKKILLVILLIIGLCSFNGFAQKAKVMLKHGHTATFYDKDQFSKAIEDAVNGDTILLTSGEFPGNIDIDKKISIIGSGPSTIISGNVYLEIKGENSVTSRLLDGLKISGQLRIDSQVNNLSVRKVEMGALGLYSRGEFKNAIFDRCQVNTLYGDPNMQGTIINSYIADIYSSAENLDFINSYIETINIISSFQNYFGGTAMNSIIKSSYYSNWNGIKESCNLINCIIGKGIDISNGFIENCHFLTEDEIDKLDRSNTNALLSAGYKGIDGKAIGEYGGQNPFTLEPSGPKITTIEFEIDPVSSELKVSITGKAN